MVNVTTTAAMACTVEEVALIVATQMNAVTRIWASATETTSCGSSGSQFKDYLLRLGFPVDLYELLFVFAAIVMASICDWIAARQRKREAICDFIAARKLKTGGPSYIKLYGAWTLLNCTRCTLESPSNAHGVQSSSWDRHV
jgi:hypothetical protein